MMNKLPPLASFVVALALPFLVGAAGGLATAGALPTWYAGLKKPSWNPPNAVFGPVWTLLYLLMGIALYLVWSARSGSGSGTAISPAAARALAFFGVQLALNLAWSFLFFGLQRPDLALLEIGLLWLAIVATIVAFLGVSRPAAYLLVPYLAWVSFATLLNAAIWSLNRPS